ncbi:MAG: hypothetical protein ABJX32_19450 [Tateyamaria sp.]|uniref:hypothetical protein n=1 Tax=Tateyamaria sp. TaxID=1929288 RepID=UPI00329B3037
MTSRTYAQIDCSLKGSKKIRGLSSHAARWAYVCAHLSDYCTYVGLFQYPLHVWAHDAQLDVSELEDCVAELVDAGLIEYDKQESFVRIVGFFNKRSGPDNPNRVDGVISDLSSFDDIEPAIYCRTVSELAVASVRRSLRWPTEGSGRTQLHASLNQFLAEVYQDYGDLFLALLNAELNKASATVGTEIKAIFPPLLLSKDSLAGKGSRRVR